MVALDFGDWLQIDPTATASRSWASTRWRPTRTTWCSRAASGGPYGVRAGPQGHPARVGPRGRLSGRRSRPALGRLHRRGACRVHWCPCGVLPRGWAGSRAGHRRARGAAAVRGAHGHAGDPAVRALDAGRLPAVERDGHPAASTATTSSRRPSSSSLASAGARCADRATGVLRLRLAGSGSTWFVEGAFPDVGRVAHTIPA